MNMTDYDVLDRYADLGFLIIFQAASEWLEARAKLDEHGDRPFHYRPKYERSVYDCEEFFKSERFYILSQYKFEGDEFLQKLQELRAKGVKKLRVTNEYRYPDSESLSEKQMV